MPALRARSIRASRRLFTEQLEARRVLATFTVTDLGNAGVGTLRDAVADANANAGTDEIVFDSSLTGGAIILTGTELVVTESVDIIGLGANKLTVSGNDNSRIFRLDNGSFGLADQNVTISNLTLANGSASGGFLGDGGGAIFTNENLILDGVVIRDSVSSGNGGALSNFYGDIDIRNSTFHDNFAYFDGGAIELRLNPSSVEIVNTTVSNNSANNFGGGIDLDVLGGTATIRSSTIVGNTANADGGPSGGGGIELLNGAMVLENSIVSGNADPSGVAVDISYGTFPNTVRYSLIGDNTGSGLTAAPVGSPDANGNFIGTSASPIDAELEPLSINPIGTPTHELKYSSPAIDAGPSIVGLPDQRGIRRDIDGNGDGTIAVDMGAAEFIPYVPLFVDTAEGFDGDFSLGDRSLEELVLASNFRSGADTIGFTPSVLGMTINTSETIAIIDDTTIEGPGANRIAISGGNTHQVFRISDDCNVNTLDVTISDVTVQNGSAADSGGAIFNNESLALDGVWIRDSVSNSRGGGLYSAGTLVMQNSTLSGNSSGSYGGALAAYHDAFDQTYLINTTVTGNQSNTEGGGIDSEGGVITVVHSTITGNIAPTGGGMHVFNGNGYFGSSISSGNSASGEPDVGTGILPYSSIIGDNSGSGLVAAPLGAPDADGNYIGTSASPIDPLLGALTIGTTSTPTLPLLPGSPAIENGEFYPLFTPFTDQIGLPRAIDGDLDGVSEIDMGAVEFTPAFDLIVGNNSDVVDGRLAPISELSLREATIVANAIVGHDTIRFDPLLAGSTITLNGTALEVTDSVDIMGLGATQLTVSGDSASAIFVFDDGVLGASLNARVDGLTLTEGSADRGGAILVDENLEISNSTLTGNTAGIGGAVAQRDGSLRVRNSAIVGNSASSYGGGISAYILADTSFELLNSTVSGNSADGGGGLDIVNNSAESAKIRHSTIAFNTANAGAGVYIFQGPVAFDHSIIAKNIDGGGAFRDVYLNASGSLESRYTLVGDNTDSGLAAAPVGSPDAHGNLVGTAATPIDPLLSALGVFGGETLNHGLLIGSPAADAGDPLFAGAPFFDQRGIPYDRVFDGRIDMGAIEGQPISPLTGDFDGDGDYDCADIDALTAQIATGVFNLLFDIYPDGALDTQDIDAWLAEAGEVNLGYGLTYLYGDATLDGTVDGLDFIEWNSNKFTNNTAWCGGNFNGDAVTDGLDFIAWNGNKFQSSFDSAPLVLATGSEFEVDSSLSGGELHPIHNQRLLKIVKPHVPATSQPVLQEQLADRDRGSSRVFGNRMEALDAIFAGEFSRR